MSFSSGSMGTLTMPSPTHVHHVDVVGSAVRTLRRSMSRSPSKFSLRQGAAQPSQPSRSLDVSVPSSHQSPSPAPASPSLGDAARPTPAHATPSSSFFSTTPQAPVPTPLRSGVKLSVRSARPRPATNRPLTRTRTSPKSPLKRAFGPAADSGNTIPTSVSVPEPRGQENHGFGDLSLGSPSILLGSRPLLEKKPSRHSMHLDVTGSSKSGVTRFLEIAEPHPTTSVSPLKRSDATMDLDQPNFGSPVAKRRSLHGISSLGADLGIFGSPAPAPQPFDVHEDATHEYQLSGSFMPPMRDPQPSPTPYNMPRRASSLRKTTLQQRHGEGRTSWGRRSGERQLAQLAAEAAAPVLRSRPRLSLDQYMPPDERGSPFSQAPLANPSIHPVGRLQQAAQPAQPHPLSRTLTQSSSNSSVTEESPTFAPAPQFERPRKPLNFSKSLPLGSQRPTNDAGPSVATPAYQKAKPFQAAFMSTGLVSKMDKRPDFGVVKVSGGKSIAMPDTPCKKPMSMTYPSATYPPQSGSGRRHSRASLGSPSTPFSPRSSRGSNPFSNAGDKALSPFAKRIAAGHARKQSSVSTEADELGDFPGGFEDFPNTPTKSLWKRSSASMPAVQTPDLSRTFHPFPISDFERQLEVPDRSCKSLVPPRFQSYNIWQQQLDDQPRNGLHHPSVSAGGASPCLRLSLRTFRQSRDVRGSFSSPAPSQTIPACPVAHNDARLGPIKTDRTLPASPLDRAGLATKSSPQTPQESFVPPDASGLSISNTHEHKAGPAQPPATPTMQYGKMFTAFGNSRLSFTPQGPHAPKDVDEALLSRFSQVELIGKGEFSQVFRVTQSSRPASLRSSLFSSTPTRRTPGALEPEKKVFAVKKLRVTSIKERETKLREVAILKALSNSTKVVHYLNSWEENEHLYIQTEFCAEGSLDSFLKTVGLTGRLDDFRIWKIMLEIAQGLCAIHDAGFIHLDLKPANVLVNFDGYLKIGDFGLATSWPAPRGIESEGDREYIGPEILRGQFDKPADLFALGLIVLEIACNVFLPENGPTWQALRSGDMSAVPSLTSTDASRVARDANGVPIEHESGVSPLPDLDEFEETLSLRGSSKRTAFPFGLHDRHATRGAGNHFGNHKRAELLDPPEFMRNASSPASLDSTVRWLIQPEPSDRPTASQLLDSDPIRWVLSRRVAGATVYEGNWGPEAPSIGEDGMDTEMMDV